MSISKTKSIEADLLVEIFCEELPPKSLQALSESFGKSITNALQEAQLISENPRVKIFASPRRIAVFIHSVASQANDYPIREKLLPVSIGLDQNGKASPPLLKKLSALGYENMPIESLERAGEGKNETFYLNTNAKGASLENTVQSALKTAIEKLPIAKMMHYQVTEDSGRVLDVEFARPVHRLLALHGDQILNVDAFGIKSDRLTEGHRFLSSGSIAINKAEDYEQMLEKKGKVIASFEKRKQKIAQQLKLIATNDEVLMPELLLNEVTALVEWPAIYACHFDEEFLEVPSECLVLTMQTNQKYFALMTQEGQLSNRFLIVSNIETQHPQHIISGNEKVIRPRLADARFFFTQDKKRTLESRIPELVKVIYHNQLGNQLQRMERVRNIAEELSGQLNKSGFHIQNKDIRRAAEIAKTDLLTDMVGEFPELQGIMGCYYALHDGEKLEVAHACAEHYLPRFAGDRLPDTEIGTVLAIADKLETLVGIWSLGLAPTGDKDPFALRRHALGICRLLIEKNLALDLHEMIQLSIKQFEAILLKEKNCNDAVFDFIFERLKAYLRDQTIDHASFSHFEIEAVLSQKPTQFNDLIQRLNAIRAFNLLPEAQQLASANKRISNILKKNPIDSNSQVKTALLQISAENELHSALIQIQASLTKAYLDKRFLDVLQALVSLSKPIDHFFADVMVMDQNIELRNNRLALLKDLHRQMNLVADISALAPQS
jgi:glycyl-tRNA synthetase beta chain